MSHYVTGKRTCTAPWQTGMDPLVGRLVKLASVDHELALYSYFMLVPISHNSFGGATCSSTPCLPLDPRVQWQTGTTLIWHLLTLK